METNKLEEKIGIKFKNKDLLKIAFVHRSYLNENAELGLRHNERLEFLGDAVLEFIVSKHLFENYPKHPEGDLTSFRSALVNSKTLSKVAKKLNLGEFLYLSRGEEETGGRERPYILANTLEALLGAIYIDQGIKKASSFVKKNLLPELKIILEKKLYRDSKSLFQEMVQEEIAITPTYKLLEESGPDHQKKFKMGVFVKSKLYGEGKGKSKQEAEQKAAKEALDRWREKK